MNSFVEWISNQEFFIIQNISFSLFLMLAIYLFIFSIVDFTSLGLLTFFKDNVRALLYYGFFTYSVFYGLKLINWVKEFIKENDLFAYAFFEKKLSGGKLK